MGSCLSLMRWTAGAFRGVVVLFLFVGSFGWGGLVGDFEGVGMWLIAGSGWVRPWWCWFEECSTVGWVAGCCSGWTIFWSVARCERGRTFVWRQFGGLCMPGLRSAELRQSGKATDSDGKLLRLDGITADLIRTDGLFLLPVCDVCRCCEVWGSCVRSWKIL